MYSISSIAKNTYLMYSYAQKNGVSLTSSYGSSVSSLSGSTSDTTTALNNFWKNYSSSSSSSTSSSSTLSSDLNTLSNIKSGMSDLLASYATTSKTFHAELGSTLSDLKGSATKVAKMSFDVGGVPATATTGTTASGTASGTSASTSSTKLTDVLKNIKSLVSDYNSAISFFSDNSSVSSRVKSLASSFSDTTYNARTYAKIGINVDSSTGKLSIDETKLTKALQETPDRVANLLGSNGLAGKAENKVSLAESQKSNLFPSVSTMLGSELKTASLYNAKTLTAISSYTNVGSLLDLYF